MEPEMPHRPVLRVTELFRSIQGETARAGYISLFIRLSGCNLNCRWCDTAYARSEGTETPIDDILEAVRASKPFHHITVTGGEPLCQPGALTLLARLADAGYAVQLETNGSLPVREASAAVRRILDVKTPSSGEEGSFLMENLSYLRPGDEIKFVISDQDDYNYSSNFLAKYLSGLQPDIVVNFSPAAGSLPPEALAGMILADGLPVRLNLQLHTIIWPGGEPR